MEKETTRICPTCEEPYLVEQPYGGGNCPKAACIRARQEAPTTPPPRLSRTPHNSTPVGISSVPVKKSSLDEALKRPKRKMSAVTTYAMKQGGSLRHPSGDVGRILGTITAPDASVPPSAASTSTPEDKAPPTVPRGGRRISHIHTIPPGDTERSPPPTEIPDSERERRKSSGIVPAVPRDMDGEEIKDNDTDVTQFNKHKS